MTAQKMDALDIEIYQLMKELGIPASMTGLTTSAAPSAAAQKTAVPKFRP